MQENDFTEQCLRPRFRAIALGIALIIANAYWTHWAGDRDGSTPFLQMWTIFANVVALIFLLVLINLFLVRYLPRLALRPAELLVLYFMLMLSSSICTGAFLYWLTPMIAYMKWGFLQNPHWASLLGGALPPFLALNDLPAARGFHVGDSSIYQLSYIRAWLTPLFWWSLLVGFMLIAMFCISRLLLTSWTRQERLAFPLATPPLLMTTETRSLLSDRLVWIGMAFPFMLSVVNILKQVWPSVPTIPLWFDLTTIIRDLPWAAQRTPYLEITPLTFGLTLLAPRELSLSLWLFNLLWRAAAILGARFGLTPGADIDFPYYTQQALGGSIALVAGMLWLSRKYLKQVALQLVSRGGDQQEAWELRLAAAGLLGSVVALGAILLYFGLSPVIMVCFVALCLTIAIAAARLRSQAGPPSVDISSGAIVPDVVGTMHLSRTELGVFTLMFPVVAYSPQSTPMGIQMEGMHLFSRTRIRGIALIFLLTLLVTLLATFWSALDVAYRVGLGTAKVSLYAGTPFAEWRYSVLASWLTTPSSPGRSTIGALGAGAFITLVLTSINARFVGWPLHPAGFILGSSVLVHWQFPAIFAAWAVKALIIRYWGVRAHRRALGIGVGLIIGNSIGTMLELVFAQLLRVARGIS